jgi:hypothetical protein
MIELTIAQEAQEWASFYPMSVKMDNNHLTVKTVTAEQDARHLLKYRRKDHMSERDKLILLKVVDNKL